MFCLCPVLVALFALWGIKKFAKLIFHCSCFPEHKRAKIVPKKFKLIEILINHIAGPTKLWVWEGGWVPSFKLTIFLRYYATFRVRKVASLF